MKTSPDAAVHRGAPMSSSELLLPSALQTTNVNQKHATTNSSDANSVQTMTLGVRKFAPSCKQTYTVATTMLSSSNDNGLYH